jgi:hypothetical protein
MLLLPSGIIQIQSLYEGSRGPGAARLLGVTAFVNGQAGLGPDVHSAVRQAINSPPTIAVTNPPTSVVIQREVTLGFEVKNGQREDLTITSKAGTLHRTFSVVTGRASVTWIPTAAGPAKVEVKVHGQDGTQVSTSAKFTVLSLPPEIRVPLEPTEAVVGQPLGIGFEVSNAVDELVRVSTRSGVVFERSYVIHKGSGLITWTPTEVGQADVIIRVRGREDQVTTKTLHLTVLEGSQPERPPTVRLLRVPDVLTVGVAAQFIFDADGCEEVVATVEGPVSETSRWRFPCPSHNVSVMWTPVAAGQFVFTVNANGTLTSAQVSVKLTVGGAA